MFPSARYECAAVKLRLLRHARCGRSLAVLHLAIACAAGGCLMRSAATAHADEFRSGAVGQADRPVSRRLDELEIEVAAIAAGQQDATRLGEIAAAVQDVRRGANSETTRKRAQLLVDHLEQLRHGEPQRDRPHVVRRLASNDVTHPEALAQGQSWAPYPVLPIPVTTSGQFARPSAAFGLNPILASSTANPILLTQCVSPPPTRWIAPPPPTRCASPAPYVPPPPACRTPPPVVAPVPYAFPPAPAVATPMLAPYYPPLPRHYVSLDALGWWVKGDKLPPLVTTSPIGTPQTTAGVLGLPTTSVLFGNQTVNNGIRLGGRIQGGVWVDPQQRFAIEGNYFALATESTTFSATSTFSNGATTDPILARPFFDANPMVNAQAALLVAYPGFVVSPGVVVNIDGSVNIRESSNIQSAGAGGRFALNPFTAPSRFYLLGAYRYFQLNEGLTILSSINPGNIPLPIPPGHVDVFDSFLTTNSFNGGEIGLAADFQRTRWSLGVETRLALGNMREGLSIDGHTSAIAGGFVASYPGGLLTQPSNIGNFSRDRFTLIPQVDAKIGYQLLPALRLTVGYNFTYVTHVLRPGAQVDTTVNTTQVAGGTLVGPVRPVASFNDSGIWLQGVTAGFDLRF